MFGFRKSTKEKMIKNGVHLTPTQWMIYDAVSKMGHPVTARKISEFLGFDSASVTPRLPKMVDISVLDVAYISKGLDGHYRKHYTVGINGR